MWKTWNYFLSWVPRPQINGLHRNRPPSTELSDIIHTEISEFAVIRDSRETNSLPKSRAELVLGDYELYYSYHDRRYLALSHYPSCLGRTLSVGVHAFNRNDWMFMGNPDGFETIELEEVYAEFGSPAKHTTGDFLSFDPNYRFQDIVLFGVLGIPKDSSRDGDSYTLFDKESAVIKKADQLLDINGRIVVGPDLNLDRRTSRELNLRYWLNFFGENEVLRGRYIIEHQLETLQNLLVVFRKLA